MKAGPAKIGGSNLKAVPRLLPQSRDSAMLAVLRWPKRKSGLENESMPVEVSFRLKDFKNALKHLFVLKPTRGQAKLEYVDFNTGDDEVELVTTGIASSFPARIKTHGYARIPYPTFSGLSRSLRNLSEQPVVVSIHEGELKAANLAFRHPRITIRPTGVRIADLPVNASLCDVLRLFLHFQTPELKDSGLLARVMEAQTEVADLIDRITVLLKPLGIEREAISQFVWEQIKEGATIQQLGAGGGSDRSQ